MRKYLNIFKTSLRQESKTFANALTSSVSFIVIIYIFKQLWQFIYGGNGGGTLIHGYTVKMMIWYMIMSEVFMYAVNARTTTIAFGNDINDWACKLLPYTHHMHINDNDYKNNFYCATNYSYLAKVVNNETDKKSYYKNKLYLGETDGFTPSLHVIDLEDL